jgi:hypothetical protein
MPIRLEVTGETPKEFYAQVLQTLTLMVAPHTIARQVPVAEKQSEPPVNPAPTVDEVAAAMPDPEPMSEPATSVVPPEGRAKRGRPRKEQPVPAPVEAGPNPNAQPPGLDEGIPDFLQRAVPQKPEPVVEPERVYELADVKTRVQDILKAANKRAEAAGKDAAGQMRYAAAYTRQLLTKFDIKKTDELAAERYGEFMAASEAFVNGTAADPEEVPA